MYQSTELTHRVLKSDNQAKDLLRWLYTQTSVLTVKRGIDYVFHPAISLLNHSSAWSRDKNLIWMDLTKIMDSAII